MIIKYILSSNRHNKKSIVHADAVAGVRAGPAADNDAAAGKRRQEPAQPQLHLQRRRHRQQRHCDVRLRKLHCQVVDDPSRASLRQSGSLFFVI